MSRFEQAEFKEDAYEEGSNMTLRVGLGTGGQVLIAAEDESFELAPVYFKPDTARRIAAALMEAARVAEGKPDALGLFGVDS